MKKLILVTALLTLVGCATVPYAPDLTPSEWTRCNILCQPKATELLPLLFGPSFTPWIYSSADENKCIDACYHREYLEMVKIMEGF